MSTAEWQRHLTRASTRESDHDDIPLRIQFQGEFLGILNSQRHHTRASPPNIHSRIYSRLVQTSGDRREDAGRASNFDPPRRACHPASPSIIEPRPGDVGPNVSNFDCASRGAQSTLVTILQIDANRNIRCILLMSGERKL